MTTIKKFHERLIRIEKTRVKQAQIAPNIHATAEPSRFDGFDNKFDEFVERMQKMLSQMKPLPLVKDA